MAFWLSVAFMAFGWLDLGGFGGFDSAFGWLFLDSASAFTGFLA